jgi:hypothetical protein
LRNEPVYQNEMEGFRFLAPEGWRQHAKAEVPRGKLEKERLLVQYVRLGSEKGASLDVSMADLPASTDLTTYLAGPSGGVKSWRPQLPAAAITLNGVPAQRLTFTNGVSKDETTKEVVAVRRGERVYFFTAYFASSDAKAREEVRRTVASTLWKD